MANTVLITGGAGFVAPRGGDVVHGHGPATFAQAGQHGAAHVAGTDKSHRNQGSHV